MEWRNTLLPQTPREFAHFSLMPVFHLLQRCGKSFRYVTFKTTFRLATRAWGRQLSSKEQLCSLLVSNKSAVQHLFAYCFPATVTCCCVPTIALLCFLVYVQMYVRVMRTETLTFFSRRKMTWTHYELNCMRRKRICLRIRLAPTLVLANQTSNWFAPRLFLCSKVEFQWKFCERA